jgi:hypothetical protein
LLELECVEEDGGRVRVRGPLGLSRVARTSVEGTERPRLLTGTADIGRKTHAAVRWEIAPLVPDSSHVRFVAHVERASKLDRAVLALGGRWWLKRIVERALQRLGAAIDAQPPRLTR